MDVKTLVETYQTANPFTLAENLNIPYQYVNFPENLKGQIVVYDEKPTILLNDSIKETPANYLVMAHELKHALDHPDLLGYYSLCYGGKGKLEREANDFAEQLMYLFQKEQELELPNEIEENTKYMGEKMF